MQQNVDLVCFGELLWDVLPGQKVAGGAPFNIVNRATALGLRAFVISSVGKDELGDELVRIVENKGNHSTYIQRHSGYPTSTVEIEVQSDGEPSYTFRQPVAWDDITINEDIVQLTKDARTFIYSSLALRDPRSRSVLFDLLDHTSLKICDVNLREGQYTRSTVEAMLKKADILRMNEFELQKTVTWLDIKHNRIEDQLKALADLYRYDTVIVTLGSEGALSLKDGRVYRQSVFPVNVKDTVGSGDAFLASYVYGRLSGKEEQDCLRFACAVGAVTASKHGGTPSISMEEIDSLMSSN